MLKRNGDRTPPWGATLVAAWYWEKVPLIRTWKVLLQRTPRGHRRCIGTRSVEFIQQLIVRNFILYLQPTSAAFRSSDPPHSFLIHLQQALEVLYILRYRCDPPFPPSLQFHENVRSFWHLSYLDSYSAVSAFPKPRILHTFTSLPFNAQCRMNGFLVNWL